MSSSCRSVLQFVLLQVTNVILLKWLPNIPWCVRNISFSRWFIGKPRWIHPLAVADGATTALCCRHLCLMGSCFLDLYLVVRAYHCPDLLRNHRAVRYNGCINLHPHWQCGSLFPYGFMPFVFVHFWKVIIPPVRSLCGFEYHFLTMILRIFYIPWSVE